MQAGIGIVKEGCQFVRTVTIHLRIHFRNGRRQQQFFHLFRVGNEVNLVRCIGIKEDVHRERRQGFTPAIHTDRVFQQFIVILEDNELFRHGFIHPNGIVPPTHIGVNLQRLATFVSTIGRPHRHRSLPAFVIRNQDVEVLDIRFCVRNDCFARILGIFKNPDFVARTRTRNVGIVGRPVCIVLTIRRLYTKALRGDNGATSRRHPIANSKIELVFYAQIVQFIVIIPRCSIRRHSLKLVYVKPAHIGEPPTTGGLKMQGTLTQLIL